VTTPAAQDRDRRSGGSPAAVPLDVQVPAPHPDAPPAGTLLGSHYERCFGCGGDHPTGLHMQVTVGEGVRVHGEFIVTAEHQGAPGLAHGGLLGCAFDEALGSLSWLLRRPMVTAHLETDFRRPVPVGSTLHITAECVGVRGRKVFSRATGHLGSPDGPVAVRAAALFLIVGIEHFYEHGRRGDVEAAMDQPAVRALTRDFEVNP